MSTSTQATTRREQILLGRLKALVDLIDTCHNLYGQPHTQTRRVTQWLREQDSYKAAANTVYPLEAL